MNAPLIIEFIGLPGAGKTTIAHLAIENLSKAGYKCFGLSTLENPENLEKKKGGIFSKLKTLYRFVYVCVLHRRFAFNAFLFSMHVKPFSFVNLRRFLILLARLKFLRTLMKDHYDFIILDQGLIQYIWSIAITAKQSLNKGFLNQVLKSILDELSLFVIMVDIETELAVKRIVNRPTMRSRFDRMPSTMAESMLSTHKEIFSQIIQSTDTFKDTGFLSVNGSQPIKKNVGLIVPFLEQARRANIA